MTKLKVVLITLLIMLCVGVGMYLVPDLYPVADEKVIHTSPPPLNITEYSYVDESYNASTDDGSFGAGGGHGICTSTSVFCRSGMCHVKIKRWCDNETSEWEKMRTAKGGSGGVSYEQNLTGIREINGIGIGRGNK